MIAYVVMIIDGGKGGTLQDKSTIYLRRCKYIISSTKQKGKISSSICYPLPLFFLWERLNLTIFLVDKDINDIFATQHRSYSFDSCI